MNGIVCSYDMSNRAFSTHSCCCPLFLPVVDAIHDDSIADSGTSQLKTFEQQYKVQLQVGVRQPSVPPQALSYIYA